MNKIGFASWVKNYFEKVDWKILLFLVVFLNVKLVVKLFAILLIYLLRFNFKFGFRARSSRLPLFYVLVIIIGVIGYLLNGNYFNLNYNFSFLIGIFSWLLCILAIHQVRLAVDNRDVSVIRNTIIVFFLVNALVTFGVYAYMVIGSGSLNPYLYQGQYQKYFMNTGDKIRGLSFDTSTTNAIINAMGVIYFLNQKKFLLTLICMIVLTMATSNVTNFLLAAVFLYLFLFQTDRAQKSIIVVCLFMMLIFIAKISPQNDQYITDTYHKLINKVQKKSLATRPVPITERPDSLLSTEEKKQKIAQLYLDSLNRSFAEQIKVRPNSSPIARSGIKSIEPNIHTPPFQRIRDTTQIQKRLRIAAVAVKADSVVQTELAGQKRLPGKILSFRQTFDFLKQHPKKIAFGDGVGNFSSKLALRTTGFEIAGSYPKKFVYINPDFRENHLADFLYYFSRDQQFHSILNTPNSVYNQLAGEYGILGLAAFFIFYIGFFIRRTERRSIAIPLLLLLCGVFLVEYWFEQLSVVIIFELLILTQFKSKTKIEAE